MNQNAGTLNQYANLIELIGRQSELLGTPMWGELAIDSDGTSIESGFDPLSALHDNILQDAVKAIGQDGAELLGHEAIGQDGVPGLLGHEAIGQDGTDNAQV